MATGVLVIPPVSNFLYKITHGPCEKFFVGLFLVTLLMNPVSNFLWDYFY